MQYEWFIAKRYLWSKRRHAFVGVVSGVSLAGIALGTASLIVTMAVMSGFDEDLKDRIIGTRAHAIVSKDGGFSDYPQVIQNLEKESSVLSAAPFVEGQALVQHGEWGTGVLVRGIDPLAEKKTSKIFKHLLRGNLNTSPGSAILGTELAKRLHIRPGETFQILSQNKDKPMMFTVDGIFSLGMYEYDANLLFIPLASAQELFTLPAQVSGVSVALKNSEGADAFKKSYQKKLGYPYFVSTWMEMNQTLFGALQLEKIVMFLILALIILVASLNIAGSLTILVTGKAKDIGILKSFGVPSSGIVKIFMLDGLCIGVAGSGLGLAAGSGICFLLKNYPIIQLPREIYYLDRLPVRMNPVDVSLVLGTAILLSLACSVYPAWTAGRLDPVKALKS